MNASRLSGFREIHRDGTVDEFQIETWDDLEAHLAQGALERCRNGTSQLVCRCRAEEDYWPPLAAARRRHDRYLSCVRLHIQNHGADCAFEFLYGDAPQRLYATSIFAPHCEVLPTPSSDRSNCAHERAETESCYLTFPSFCLRETAAAAVVSFVTANRHSPNQPPAAQFLQAIDTQFRCPKFAGSVDAYAAAREQGTTLRFGLIFRRPTSAAKGSTLLNVAVWSDMTLRLETCLVATEILEDSLGRLRGIRSLLPPPWLVIATVNPEGRIRRLWLQRVWSDGLHLVAADSNYERLAASFLRSQRETLLKVLRREDIPIILSRLGQSESVSHVWNHKPDHFCWRGPQAAQVARLIEVCGFRPGEKEEYDKNIEAKLARFRTLGNRWEVEKINGWDIPLQPPCIESPAQWKSPAIQPGGLSPAARAWISRSEQPNPGLEQRRTR